MSLKEFQGGLEVSMGYLKGFQALVAGIFDAVLFGLCLLEVLHWVP